MLRLATVSLLTLSIIACGDQATEKDYDDVAAATADLLTDSGGELDGMDDAVDTATGEPPAILTRAGDGSWTGQRGQITYQYDLVCRDIDDAVLEVCDETTDEATLTLAWSGQVDTARRFANIERTGQWTLSSLTSTVVNLDGTGQYSIESEFEALARPVMRAYAFDYQAQYNGVQYDRSIGRPVGGSISYLVSADRTESRRFRDIEASFTVDAEVTFSPDGTATIVLDGERQYEVTLASGTVVQVAIGQ